MTDRFFNHICGICSSDKQQPHYGAKIRSPYLRLTPGISYNYTVFKTKTFCTIIGEPAFFDQEGPFPSFLTYVGILVEVPWEVNFFIAG